MLPVPLLWTREELRIVELPDGAQPRCLSDENLLTALKGRDRDALAEVFQRYSRLVFSIGFRILRDAGEAEDLVQEVFLFLFQRAELFDEKKGGAKAWIVQIAWHRSLDRREYLHRRSFYSGTDVSTLSDTLTGTEDVEDDLASKLSRERLKEAFQSLSDRQRLTLELFFFEDLDLREIAARLDESFENVRHHYYRGLQKLRKDAFVEKLRGRKQS
ncbi:RNA polymerase sigma factor [Paracidobacterium acidisoli]|nr:sigma-70 family RNA polymerase sigma factor [Paracidobacterium acidisoli]MBT9330138.1 sigma-70 family RNA polymerase sigma factor [Paracidobacterium acidisoli]